MKPPIRLLMSEKSERAFGEWLMQSPFRRPLVWMTERLVRLASWWLERRKP